MDRHDIHSVEKTILVGGGGHALSLLEAMPDTAGFAGYLALRPSESMPLPWLGTDDMALQLKDDHLFHMAFVYSRLPIMTPRRKLLEKYREMGVRFGSVIAPNAVVTRNATVGDGCAILQNAIINRAHLGENVVVNTGAIVEHDCTVGDNTFIGPGAVIGGAVKIGRDCFVGLGSRLKNGITLADGVSVGMGTVITESLREPGIYFGNPLKFHPVKG